MWTLSARASAEAKQVCFFISEMKENRKRAQTGEVTLKQTQKDQEKLNRAGRRHKAEGT